MKYKYIIQGLIAGCIAGFITGLTILKLLR